MSFRGKTRGGVARWRLFCQAVLALKRTSSFAVWPLLYACAQPYYPSSGSDGQLSLVSIYGRANPCSKDPLFPKVVQRSTALHQLHRKQVVAVSWEPQNSSPTACVWRWNRKSWPVCPNSFEKIPIFALNHTYQLRGGADAQRSSSLRSPRE